MIDPMLTAYIEAALWSTLDYDELDEAGNNPHLDERYSISDIDADTLDRMRSDCAAFAEANADDLETYYQGLGYDESQAGHDFWLTRERHGAGFWARYVSGGNPDHLQAALDRLTDAATAYGEFSDELNEGIVRPLTID